MKAKLFFLFTLLFISSTIFPCGNSYRQPQNTDVYWKGNKLDVFNFKEGFDDSALMIELTKLADAVKSQFNVFEDNNDRALTYMRMGQYDTANAILSRLEKEKPNEYNIIANLGTLYELQGENEKALAYIKKAVALNSASHHGSEWFHIQILEAKLQGRNSDWWITHPVLNLSAIKKDPETIISDITYQLKERIPFTKKPDLMMAATLKESGAYLEKHYKQQQAWIAYKIATEYDGDSVLHLKENIDKQEKYFSSNNIPVPNYGYHYSKTGNLVEKGKNLLERGIEYFNEQQKREQERLAQKKKGETTALIIAGAVILVALLAWYLLRKKKEA